MSRLYIPLLMIDGKLILDRRPRPSVERRQRRIGVTNQGPDIAMKHSVTLHVNGERYEVDVRSHHVLLDVLRDQLALTGTNDGCRTGNCGACTVLVDGRPVPSCLLLAPLAAGRHVTTIEGLAADGNPHPLQQAFVEHGAIQCGYCTPGMILSAYALLEETPRPCEDEVCAALKGHLCRCTGYVKIVEAVMAAGEAQTNERNEDG